MHDPPGQSADQANERKGLRELFRKVTPENGVTDDAEPGAEQPAEPGAEQPAEPGAEQPAEPGAEQPAERTSSASALAAQPASGTRPAKGRQLTGPLVSRPVIKPHLRADPRLRVWVTRSIVSFIVFVGFGIGVGWRYGLTAAVIYVAADSIYRSKTTAVVPASVRVTSAQRFTRRRLKVLHAAGYRAMHARTIPGTRHVIDHVVVGPAGIFALDSQRLDRRLPLRVIDGMLYHGRASMEDRLDHAKLEAKHAATLIAAELGQRVRVRPVMVMYGPSISWVIMRVKGVAVFDGSRVGTYFKRQSKAAAENQLSPDQIAAITAASERALPPLN